MSQANLATVFDHLHAMRRGDIDSVASRLHPDVVHQGVSPHLLCADRDQVLESMRRALDGDGLGIEHLEILDTGDRVVVGLSGPRFRDVPHLAGQLFIVFTLRDGRIARMDDHRTRAEALAAAGGAPPSGWE